MLAYQLPSNLPNPAKSGVVGDPPVGFVRASANKRMSASAMARETRNGTIDARHGNVRAGASCSTAVLIRAEYGASPMSDAPHIVFVCTGNAARSVMAGAILATHVADAEVEQLAITTAGTHVVEGMPMSWRTRDALAGIDVQAPGHRSTQLRDEHVDAADLVVCLAREHVDYVRRTHPGAAARTGTLRRVARDLAPGPEPLRDRVVLLGLADVGLEEWEDVIDPAGGDLPEFEACAREIRDLIAQLAPALR